MVTETTAWWWFGGLYGMVTVMLLLDRFAPPVTSRSGPAEVEHRYPYSFAAGMGLLGAACFGLVVVTELPAGPPAPPTALLLLAAAAAARAAPLAWQQRGGDGSLPGAYALGVDLATILLAVVGAVGVTGWGVIRTLAWANVGAGAAVLVAWLVLAVLI